VVICPEQGADLHAAQLMPLPLTVSCFSKIQIGFTFLVPAQLGSPRQRAIKWVRVIYALTDFVVFFIEFWFVCIEQRHKIVSAEVEPADEDCDWPSDPEDSLPVSILPR